MVLLSTHYVIMFWLRNKLIFDYTLLYRGLNNGVARTLKKLCTLKGDYWIKQRFSSIASLFIKGTSHKGNNLLPEGTNFSEQFLREGKITFTLIEMVLLSTHYVIMFWLRNKLIFDYTLLYRGLNNGVARTLKKLCTLKGDYWIKQRFSSIASLFIKGTSHKGNNLLPEGTNFSEQFLREGKITFTTLGDLH